MKLIEAYQHWKKQCLWQLQSNLRYLHFLKSLFIVGGIAVFIWLVGPQFSWGDYVPLASTEKRYYLILFIFLLLLLKFLLLDFEKSQAIYSFNLKAKNHLQEIYFRFRGAIRFLKK